MAYSPKEHEQKIYERWERSGFFNPDKLPGRRRKAFSIAMPPPNVTGDLHIGHALTMTLEDLMIRYHRMRGEAALWIPGTDHAGIATQIMVERMLAEQGTSRQEIGRGEFLEHVWRWKETHASRIVEQIKAMAASCDWSREHFTMDQDLSEAVREAFIRLFEDGLIYRSTRLINWCPNDRTALSDLEVGHEERAGSLWFIRYPVKSSSHAITVATTRPETMLGDVAVAVHPKDGRYHSLIGKAVVVPITNREVPVIADERVEPEFGTGAIKVTPAHDFLDAEIAKTHKLPAITVIGPDGRMTGAAGKDLEGLPVHEARLLVVEALNRDGLLEQTEDYRSAVTVCDRCGTTIEPQVSKQWFVKMAPLAKKAITAVKRGKITILPKRFEKVYFHWLENIQDWCISRQLWWGHQLPIWYCIHCDEPVASVERPSKRCRKCRRKTFHQDEGVLDTWFSSGLWTFSTLGWPRNQTRLRKKGDLKRFHPTSVMETGWDILFFWVSRMVMLSLYLVGEVPFRTVYLNGLILDREGRKMSKSKGTGVDPDVMTSRYGTDALRLSLTIGQSAGQDFRMYEEKVAGMRNFVNKLWNIGQYVETRSEERGARPSDSRSSRLVPRSSLADRWILSRLAHVTKEVTKAIDRYDFSFAGQQLIDFTWHEFADWYVEIHKVERNDGVLVHVYETVLKLLHPFAPFVTEVLWQQLAPRKANQLLMIETWPKPGKRDQRAERDFADLQRTVVALRNFKKYSGLTAHEAGTIRTNGSKVSQQLLEKLTGVNLDGEQAGDRITLGAMVVEFPAERVRAFQTWRVRERARLTAYLTKINEQRQNPRLPEQVRRQLESKLAEAERQLRDVS